MKRLIVASALVAVGAISIVAAGYQGDPQGPKVVTMQTMNVRDILYLLTGGGGNTLALMRDEGVVLIDTKLPGWGQPMLDAITSVTDKPVTTIINTDTHADHVSGNGRSPTLTQ